MSTVKNLGLCLLLAALPACGDNLVEFAGGSGGGDDDEDGDAADDGDTGDDAAADDGDGLDDDGAGDGPTVLSSDPDDDALDVSLGKRVHATFDMSMNAETITEATFTVQQGSADIDGEVTYDAATMTATFVPDDDLDLSLEYTATITTGAEAPGGAALADDHVWTFETGACSLAPLDLGSVASFAVLAGSAVTSTGLTEVIGDLGVSPGTSVTGFGPGTVDGDQHAGDNIAEQAMADLTIAYGDAAARTLCAVTVDGNLGGRTFGPGLYNSGSSLEISSGDLTLDAAGDEDAIFIFQMESTLTTTSGRQVILSGGARSTSVYWQVGTSATLGTGSVLHGTIMADQSITLNTDATLTGRALARIAAVDLDANPITLP
jgi:hypothetical protein